MTKARVLIVGIAIVTAVFAVVLWYFQTRAFYEEFTRDTVEIAGRPYAVTGHRGIDADTSPQKLRACFTLTGALEAPLAEDPTPLIAPTWFDCFDAGQLTADLSAGHAKAYLAVSNVTYGFDEIVAVYPDGRAYQWRQINPCGTARYGGFPLPEGCPPIDRQ